MPIRIRTVDLQNKSTYMDIVSRAKEDLTATLEKVKPIIEEVRMNGDSALRNFTKKFDGLDLDRFVFDPKEVNTDSIPRELKIAFAKAKENIESFHKHQSQKSWEETISGNRLGIRFVPMNSVTVYAPGGKALYPSSILMGAIPAKIAGVPNIQLATPPQIGGIPPILAYVAQLAGIDRIITLGGAQAIAACAFGTETISKSDFIVGPGNPYVAAAKTYLAGIGVIGIESPAGPSEVLVIADNSANPRWIACDLLSQAEHGEDSVAILATDSLDLINRVEKELDIALKERTKRKEVKLRAIEDNSFLLKFDSIQDCIKFSNLYAPEHLEIITNDPRKDFEFITTAGSVFLGAYSPVAMGDYISGTNHVLPTAGGAHLHSSLGVNHFYKRITYQEITKESLVDLYPHVKAMSESEGLDEEHGHSVYLRTLDGEDQT